MPDRVAAGPPPADSPLPDDGSAPRRQLGHAYRAAFAETGTLEVVLPATERLPVQRPDHPAVTAAARGRLVAPPTTMTTPTTRTPAVPAPRSARAAAAPLPAAPAAPAVPAVPAPPAPSAPAVGTGQLARRSRAVLLGLVLGVVLGVLAVVVAGVAVSWSGLLPR